LHDEQQHRALLLRMLRWLEHENDAVSLPIPSDAELVVPTKWPSRSNTRRS
jgi:hypothetical protein